MNRRNIIRQGGAAGLLAIFGIPLTHTQGNNTKKIIVTGGHPDDPETGCGGLIALLTEAGHDVALAYLTKGEAGIPGTSHPEAARIRTEEANKACDILKCSPHFLDQIDGDTYCNRDAYKMMLDFLQGEKPDLLLTHWPIDTHRDHRICSLLTYDAWLRLENKPSLFYYEVLTGDQSQNFAPTDYVDISSVRNIKHDACFAHESQKIREYYPNDHGKMEAFRGKEGGYEFAEAYVRHWRNPGSALGY